MPFERYLRSDDSACYYQNSSHAHDCHYSHAQHSFSPENTHHHPHAVQFQIPQFILNGPPILAPGGGAEVLPAGLLDSGPNSFASSWFANNGFAPFHSALNSKHPTSGSTTDNTSTAPRNPFSSTDLQHPSFSLGFTANATQRQQPLPDLSPSLAAPPTYTPNPSLAPSLNTTSYSLSNALVPDPAPTPVLSLATPSTLGLPVYSASGLDVISILARVLHRPNPTIQLGPVDLSCSFVIVDVRRYDSPIVYASPTFCHLTGYSEQEVLGRNCRFLQSPTGSLARGESRNFTSPDSVSYMRKLLSSSKECQTTLINYRKGGHAFVNLVTVIPLRGGVHNRPEESDEIAYHIGFQVDLTVQPNRILDKLRDGSYHNGSWGSNGVANNPRLLGYSLGQLSQSQNVTNIGTKGGRHGRMMSVAVSKELKNLFADTTFTDSVPISTVPNMCLTSASGGSADSTTTMPLTMFVTPPPGSTPSNRMSAGGKTMAGANAVSISPSLSLFLLEFLPDFLLVLSLKGAFLYVAPSVRLVLGYEPEELVGRSISDVCHPADLVPLMRELKEGSVSNAGTNDVGSSTASSPLPKSVDLLFRALPKASTLSTPQQAQEASAEQHSQLSLASGSQASSLGASCSDDSSGRAAAPYVWLECRGRLHAEPGKGRKAIILSGRARWMPTVRWSSVDKAGGLGNGLRREKDIYDVSGAGSPASSRETAGAESIDPLEFWALLSNQGTFLVASASVKDVLGWGTSEVIGRSLWTMLKDSRDDIRERVEAELAKCDSEAGSTIDPPPTVMTTSMVHKEFHVVPLRLVFYRTPRPRKHASPPTSSTDVALTPLIHPINNPLCPVVFQATVLSDSEHQSEVPWGSGLGSTRRSGRMDAQTNTGDGCDESSMLSTRVSLFEELEAIRGSSWQYELQQLKFANQRLHEEVHALETSSGASVTSASSTTGTGAIMDAAFGHPHSSSTTFAAVPVSQQPQMIQTPLHYTPLVHSTLTTSPPFLRPLNSLHAQDPPPSEWSSLAGANGQKTNPLKRLWRSENGLIT